MTIFKIITTVSFFLLLLTSSYGQAVHYVTNIGDSGPGSLRQTITQAFPNDTIRFNVRGTIFLVSGEISIAKNLVIEGPGMDSLTITQLASNRLLNVNASNFTLTGLTLQKGHAIYSTGTGLTFDGGSLYLKDVKVDSCTSGYEFPNYPSSSSGNGEKGGAVDITGGSITMEDCIFVENYFYTKRRSAKGGAVYIDAAQVTIKGCLFDENKLKAYAYYTSYRPSSARAEGGALYLDATGDISIENTVFSNSNNQAVDLDTRNRAYGYGGAVYIKTARNIDLLDCDFNANITRGLGSSGYSSYSYGGAVYIAAADSVTSMDCSFDGNNTTSGAFGRQGSGAIGVVATSILIKRIEVQNTTSAVAVGLGGATIFEDNYIHDNVANGLSLSGDFRVNNCLFSRNSSGIGVYSASANNQIINTTFYQNNAAEGSAIYADNNTNAVNVINCTMVDNTSSTASGALAIYTEDGTVYLKNNIISNTVYTTKPLVARGTGGLILSGGGNILRDNSIAMFLVQPTDRNATDPRLGTFANHGGLLNTFNLQASSPAIDLGGVDTLTIDQRRFLRDANTDAGAFEFGATNPNIPTVSTPVTAVVACEGDSTAFSVNTTGTALRYQWFFNGMPIAGDTVDVLSISSAVPSNTGIYTCEVSNALDTIMSDSISLIINPITTGIDVQTACDSYTWIDGQTYTSSNNTATHTLTNAAGCDSVVTLNLTIINSSTGTDVQTACGSYTWIDGQTYTSSNNTATHTLSNAVGCDSVVTLNLTIHNSSTGTDVQTACDSYTWINGQTYTSSNNTATHTLTNAAGCDSVVTLSLTIHNSSAGTDVQTACDSYTWINGQTYTSSNNTATHTLTNAAGCDSVVTLDLTINNSTTGTDVQTACDSYTWINGQTYTSSNNTATHTLTNAAGCDSMVTLNLTIINSSTGTDVQTACGSYTWIDGQTYTSNNNTATHTLSNAVGCDSVVTLNLTIINSSTGTDVQTACDSYTWINGQTYTSSNTTATHTLTNAAGCDSVVTLDLTINNSTTGTDVQTACDSYTWINGQTYTSSNNTATHTLTNAAGCDSVVTLDLTINNSTTGTDVQTACDSYTWINGQTYTSSNNTATHTLTNAAGCDSVVTLDLTIHSIDTSLSLTYPTISSNAVGANYQWLDCSNNSPLLGDTTAIFTPLVNGDYAVEITQNGCVDTSACVQITWVNIETVENSLESIQVYPNPTEGLVYLDLGDLTNVDLTILNAIGQVIEEKRGINQSQYVIELNGAAGVYWVEVKAAGKRAIYKLIKQ